MGGLGILQQLLFVYLCATRQDYPPNKDFTMDKKIGALIKKARLECGCSQQQLGDALKVSFQQIQKYEKGKNRVSAASIPAIANLLGKDIMYFYSNEEIVTKDSYLIGIIVKQFRQIQSYDIQYKTVGLIRSIIDMQNNTKG